MALLIDAKAYVLSTFTTVLIKWVVMQRPVSALIGTPCASAMSFHRWQHVRGLNSFAGLKRRARVVAGHHFKGSETDVERAKDD